MTAAKALSAALAIADTLGLPVFPCHADKRPATPRGFKDATADPDQVRDLWRRHLGPLVGVPTGEVSGIDVFDIDAPRHPEAAEWYDVHRHRLPPTRTHHTRSGGVHLLFQHAPGMRCWTGKPVLGLDGRGDGGFAIWWPAAGLPVLCDAPPAAWPSWFLAELWPSLPLARSEGKVTIRDSDVLAGLVRKVAGAAKGERNAITFWAACRAGEMAASGMLTAATATAVIADAATKAGLPQREAERTAWSGIRTGLGSAGHA